MAVVTVRIQGGANLRKALAKMNPEQNLRIFKASAGEVAVKIETNAKEKQLKKGGGPISLPSQTRGSKRLYNRSHRLYDSIGIDFSPLPKAVEVGSERVVYAARHEYGLGGMPARPFMAPALDAVSPKIPEIVVKHWKREGGL
jgi:phage gpG-like protein